MKLSRKILGPLVAIGAAIFVLIAAVGCEYREVPIDGNGIRIYDGGSAPVDVRIVTVDGYRFAIATSVQSVAITQVTGDRTLEK